MHDLNGNDRSLLSNALRLAGEQWLKDAATAREQYERDAEAEAWGRLAEQYERQARDAERLADEIDEAAGVTLHEADPAFDDD